MNTKKKKPHGAQLPIQQAIKDPKGIWYGPHQCNGCGGMIIKKAREQGGLELDFEHSSQYPNYEWRKHECPEVPYPKPV